MGHPAGVAEVGREESLFSNLIMGHELLLVIGFQ
jgi:hypothetical protein